MQDFRPSLALLKSDLSLAEAENNPSMSTTRKWNDEADDSVADEFEEFFIELIETMNIAASIIDDYSFPDGAKGSPMLMLKNSKDIKGSFDACILDEAN